MLTITAQINTSTEDIIGVKEGLAAYLERFGDVQVVSVAVDTPEQLRVTSYGAAQSPLKR